MNSHRTTLSIIICGLFGIATLVGCGATGGASAASCPGSGTDVPFGKLMNASFASSYEGCQVRTTAVFVNANSTMSANLGDAESVVIDVGDPASPQGIEFVKMPKAASDAVFTLKQGDSITLIGGPVAWPNGGVKTHYFQASSVAKAAP